MVLAAGAELIEDVKRAQEDVLSRRKPVMEVCTVDGLESYSKQSRQLIQMDYTLPLLNIEDTYHNRVIRSNLTRNIAVTFDQVQDELVQALAEYIPVTGDGM